MYYVHTYTVKLTTHSMMKIKYKWFNDIYTSHTKGLSLPARSTYTANDYSESRKLHSLLDKNTRIELAIPYNTYVLEYLIIIKNKYGWLEVSILYRLTIYNLYIAHI